MSFPNRDPGAVTGWHAHVYYDPAATRETAAALRRRVAARFGDSVRIGRWHDETVGPHLASMYQLAFGPAAFAELVPWLALNRDGLDVLVHPNTDDAWADHLIYGFWLGEKLPLNEDALRGDGEARPR